MTDLKKIEGVSSVLLTLAGDTFQYISVTPIYGCVGQ